MLQTTPGYLPIQTGADGVARIRGTRIPLETIIAAFSEGATAEEIAQQYTTLNLADIYTVLGYYLRNPSAVETYLRSRNEQAEAVRKENELRFDSQGVRHRLLARRVIHLIL